MFRRGFCYEAAGGVRGDPRAQERPKRIRERLKTLPKTPKSLPRPLQKAQDSPEGA